MCRSSSSLPLKEFYQLLVRVALKRFPLEPEEYIRVKILLNEYLVKHASLTPADEAFRGLLYDEMIQEVTRQQ